MSDVETRASINQKGLVLGLAVFGLILLLPVPQGLTSAAWSVVALAGLMAVWWVSEAIPIPATSLLPVIMLPLMDVLGTRAAAAPYAAPVNFLLLGGFIAAMAMQRTGLHRRIALAIVARMGDHPGALMAGFMAAAAFLSMWISNTATTLMIIPIALTVAQTVLGEAHQGHRFTVALLIGCAWSGSIGGLGTYIGTPPNLFVKAFIEQSTGYEILFVEWMAFAVPIVMTMVPLAWLILAKFTFRFNPDEIKGGADVVAKARAGLGPISVGEQRVAMIMALMSFLWMTRQLFVDWTPLTHLLPFIANLTDTHIALAGALAMFLVPDGRPNKNTPIRALLSWHEAVQLPWGVLLLFGGGLSLAAAIQATGLGLWLGQAMSGLADAPVFLTMLAVVVLVIFLTELTSNTATVAALVPVMGALAGAADFNPILLAAPVAMAGSCAFMLPVATGPNAVVFATGQVQVNQMMRAGLWLNIVGSLAVTALCYTLLPRIFSA